MKIYVWYKAVAVGGWAWLPGCIVIVAKSLASAKRQVLRSLPIGLDIEPIREHFSRRETTADEVLPAGRETLLWLKSNLSTATERLQRHCPPPKKPTKAKRKHLRT